MEIKSNDNKYQKHLAIVLFLLCGTISTFAYKLQGTQRVTQGDDYNKKFFHPYMQSLTMFIGQTLCLGLYFIQKRKTKKDQINQPLVAQQKSYSPIIFLIPAIADSLSSVLQYMGLSFISGSTYMMIKGASIVTTAIFSKILFNMQIEKRHVIGCGLAIVGITIVGSSGFFDSTSGGDTVFQKQLIGYILMIVSLIFNGFFYAYQQKLLRKYPNQINPLKMVGFQGIFGIIIISITITILTFIPCSFGPTGCVYDVNGNLYWERPQQYFRQVFNSWLLIGLVISGIITIAIYNLNGLRITKFFDALARSLLNVTKTSVVWIVGIIITIIGGDNQQFKLQSLNIIVNIIKAIGFTVIIFGTLIYNQLIFKECLSKKKIVNAESIQTQDNSQILSKQLNGQNSSIQINGK